ncbi:MULTISPECIES: tRNA (guanosine(46)-N(7))-methyltransferase TrmB [unclassified Mesorhizobium]|uniref:tRNA (guanine(46)-N(7))-methyltransferase TrmB n=1 Tax=unclassified Mesorhizobium TaxID=325217 RepID=UPI0011267DB6|nr:MULTISPECIES: tRNA (guanosine(46)-N(7))-methyltransferase TrmB [unclassified Mesorhizobium]TPK91049.1 tRNA (guanosine(46)-N7)-methyltransferase TrmB [Mesorhizobium sp. B2-4-17]UCI31537.1 tRNA (guanosine(46)-N(7))-methyltransferase TrmB [Mesorhizobium sp. B4-1-4]
MSPQDRPSRTTEAFFGRRRGKPVRPQQAAALESGLGAYRLDLATAAPPDLRTLFEADVSAVRLEIGFGGGEHLLHRAVEAPTIGFIGVEPFVNGMAKMMMAVRERPLANLRVYDDDATQLLDWLPSASLEGIDLLYPDPWPKKKHWKRRFVSQVNLDRFARVLKPGSKFRFASDIDTYVNWTLLHCRAHGAFAWQAAEAADWHRPYDGWPGTRYEAKAIREGRPPAYLTFVRT